MNRGPRNEGEPQGELRGIRLTGRTLAHEINNPLALITGMTELLLNDPTTPRPLLDSLNDILHASGRISQVVKDLNNVKQVATKQTPIGEALDLDKSIKDPI